MNTPVVRIRKALLCLFILTCFAGCKKANEELALNTVTANITKNQILKMDISPNIAGCLRETFDQNKPWLSGHI
jgi:hypothetical protein